jgi:hypothetical protein
MTETTIRKLPTADDVRRCIPVPSADDTVQGRGDALGAVLWQGHQWAVTVDGLEARDGTYYIAASRLREGEPAYPWTKHMAEKVWVDVPDFQLAFAVACWAHRGEEFVLPKPYQPKPDPLADEMASVLVLPATAPETQRVSTPSLARARLARTINPKE